MRFFLDTSALLKLVVDEPESAALEAEVADGRLIASALVLTELPRACARRVPDAAATGVRQLVRRLDLVDLDRDLLRGAGALPGSGLRSLDAVHLASALRVRDVVDRFVAYDGRLLDAARDAGLRVASPT